MALHYSEVRFVPSYCRSSANLNSTFILFASEKHDDRYGPKSKVGKQEEQEERNDAAPAPAAEGGEMTENKPENAV